MAKTIEQLATAATLDGTELVELQQGDLSVKCTTQDIADLGGGGAAGPLTVTAKTADFTANGASGTIYTNEGASGTVVATLEDSAIGTEYKFIQTENGQVLSVILPDGHVFVFSTNGSISGSTTGDGVFTIDSNSIGAFISITKVGATKWAGFIAGFVIND